VRELKDWLSNNPDPAVFPYSAVLAEYHRTGKHFVRAELLATLAEIRATLPRAPHPATPAWRLRQFLDVALDKWDDRYDYRSYLALSLLRLSGTPGAGATAPLPPLPATAAADGATGTLRRRRDHLLVRLLGDALAFELAAESGTTALLPEQRPGPALAGKRYRLGVRAARPALERLGLADAVDGAGPAEAARALARVAADGSTAAEREELRLAMLPVYVVHDEYLFIRALQSYECTFALLAVELDASVAALAAGAVREAGERLSYAEELLTGSAPLFSLVATMQPESFRTFRAFTEGASAIQSRNYKRVEALCRLPDADRLDSPAYLSVGELREQILAGQPTLEESYRAAERAGLLTPADRLLIHRRMRGFATALAQWRHTHYRMATRMLGERTGTGYTEGTPYLDVARSVPVFTLLDPV
jgi:tryptophan 2,3-dioxygenase